MPTPARYQSRISLVPIPKGFKALVEQEMEKLGFWNYAEVMGHILKTYFGVDAPLVEANTAGHENEAAGGPGPGKIKKAVQNGDNKGDEPFVSYLRPRQGEPPNI